MADRNLKCVDCGVEFLYDEAEQKWMREKGFEDPKRCKGCRSKKRARLQREERKER